MPSRNIEELFEDLALKLGIQNPYDAAESTIENIEDILETVRSKATELNDLETSIEEKIDELGEVEDTLTRMEELTGELESSADDFKYIMEN